MDEGTRKADTHLVPSESTGAGDEEGLSVLGEDDLPRHPDGISKDRNEVRGDVGHGRVGIGVEDLVSAMSIRAGDSTALKSTSSVTSMGPGMLQYVLNYCGRVQKERGLTPAALGGVARGGVSVRTRIARG